MREEYLFEYWKNNQRRLQLGVIRGMSCRYLWHEELELMLSLSGEIEYFAGEKRYHLRKGDMLLFNRNCGHSIISRGSGNRTISLKLSPQVLEDWGVRASMSRPCFCVTQEPVCRDGDLRLVRKMVAGIYFYLKEEDRIFDKAAETLAVLIFVSVLHRYGMVEELDGEEGKSSGRNERMEAIGQYIMEHLTEPVTLKEVAEAAGYNKTYLSGQFKQWTGFHLSDYLKQMRIQKAIGLLEDQRYTLTEIALNCGFSDYHTFSACMAQYCGSRQAWQSCLQACERQGQKGQGNVIWFFCGHGEGARHRQGGCRGAVRIFS